MTIKKLGGLVLVLFVAATTVGCADKEKKQLAELQAQYNDLSNQNKDLRSQLSQAKAREAELLSQLDAKDAELAAAKAAKPETPAGASGWEVGLTADKVTVGTDILFAAGKATLTTAGTSALDKIVADLKGTYAGMPVRVYGHTDSDPIRKTKNLWQDNLDLSANRAMAVTRYLLSKGIDAKQIETVAMGEHHPQTSNSDKSGKAKNRRVEIVVLKTK